VHVVPPQFVFLPQLRCLHSLIDSLFALRMDQERDSNSMPCDEDVTTILGAVNRGEEGAAEKLLPLVYEELRRIARARVAQESPGHTLQPTALVHEAYLRLLGSSNVRFDNHGHFFGAAAIAMRRILIERARRKKTAREALGQRIDFDEVDQVADAETVDLLSLDRALDKLAALPGRLLEVVQLRFFAGLSVEQTAMVMGTSPRTVKRDWNFARAWLRDEMMRAQGAEGEM
jgi:RNA polymerase sigma factor (TIGR02999 family)